LLYDRLVKDIYIGRLYGLSAVFLEGGESVADTGGGEQKDA